MSYILDALRRADAERERGAVPGLYSQTVPLTDEPDAARRRIPWLSITFGAVIGIVGLLLWRSLATDPEPQPAPTPSRAEPPATARADAPTPAAAASLPQPAPIAVARQPQSSRSTDAPTPRPAPPAALPAPPPRAAPAAPAEGRSEQSTERADARSAVTAAPPGAVASGKGAEDKTVVRREQLPEDVKRNLPPLAVGGSMYSPEPAKRMLILNGQLVREGEKVAPDVVLESIQLRSAILRYKEQRFEITY
jgi:general secretion pathway protein B